MDRPTATNKKICPCEDLAAYIDGELPPAAELELELHLAVCSQCAAELNSQKKMLCALDSALAEEERGFELPEDFTRIVVANAESTVGGLRCPRERLKAFFVCTALFLLVLVGLRGEMGRVLKSFGNFIEQVWAVGGFAARLVYNIAIGSAVILRSIGHQLFQTDSTAWIALALVLLVICVVLLSRAVLKLSRA